MTLRNVYGTIPQLEYRELPYPLDDVLFFVDNQPDVSVDPNNYIGLSIKQGSLGALQFIRIDQTNWIMDIPYFENEHFSYAKVAQLSHRLVMDMIRQFYEDKNSIFTSIRDYDYESLEEYLMNQYSIELTLVDDQLE